MGDFFKPLRRQIGTLTLVMACVFTGIWVRSFVVLDVVEWAIPTLQCSWEFDANKGEMNMAYSWATEPDVYKSHRLKWWRSPAEDNHLPKNGMISLQTSWKFEGNRRVELIRLHLECWFVIVFLTPLSALLLLTKPRVAKLKPVPMRLVQQPLVMGVIAVFYVILLSFFNFSIVIPLTLISAYLLIAKSRKSIPTKTSESTANEGA